VHLSVAPVNVLFPRGCRSFASPATSTAAGTLFWSFFELEDVQSVCLALPVFCGTASPDTFGHGHADAERCLGWPQRLHLHVYIAASARALLPNSWLLHSQQSELRQTLKTKMGLNLVKTPLVKAWLLFEVRSGRGHFRRFLLARHSANQWLPELRLAASFRLSSSRATRLSMPDQQTTG
jgi:hypothetical protein